MPPKKKKPQRNGFYFFMQDIMPELRREGHQFRGIEQVVPLAHPRWKALTDRERNVYENRAKEHKQQHRMQPNASSAEGYQPDVDTRTDAAGVRVCDRIDQDKLKAQRIREEHNWSKECWPKDDDFMEYSFFLMGFESLSNKIEDHLTKYLPCEMACVEFNLKRGIVKTMHKFLVPPAIPLGYRFACTSHSESTHQIPIENFELAETDFKSIWQELVEFVNPSRSASFPPVYTMEEDAEMVSWSLEYLAQNAGHANRLKKVFFLEGLLSDLHTHQQHQAPIAVDLYNTLNSSMFDYEATTRCSYHEEKGINFCALATCTKRCYIMANTLSGIYGFDLTAGHCPPRREMTKIRVIQPASQKGRSDSRGRGPNRGPPRHQNWPNQGFNRTTFAQQDQGAAISASRPGPPPGLAPPQQLPVGGLRASGGDGPIGRQDTAGAYTSGPIGRQDTAGAYTSGPIGRQDTAGAYAGGPIGRQDTAGAYAGGSIGREDTAGAYTSGPIGRQDTAGAYAGGPIGRQDTAGAYSGGRQRPLVDATKKPLRRPFSTGLVLKNSESARSANMTPPLSPSPSVPLETLASPQRMASSYFSAQPPPLTSLGRGRGRGQVSSPFSEPETQPPFSSLGRGRGRGLVMDNLDGLGNSFSSMTTNGSGDANYPSY